MEIKKTATRDAYGKALVELGDKYDNLIVMDADLASATKTGVFKKAYPEKFFDCGIAEGNMMGIAAGLAASGKLVFASSFAMFAAGRAFEQIRNSIAYPHLNVKIGASHAGISVGEDGASHQCCEDIALMRSIPGMVIINPADEVEARQAVLAAAEYYGPVYLRFGRLAVENVFDENYKFEWGKAVRVKEGNDVTIISTGLMTLEAVKAAKILENEGVSARVLNIHTIKPLDVEAVLKAADETGAIVTAEEHNVIGGLGSAVCEAICGEHPVPVLRVGVEDTFGKSGPAKELLEAYRLNAENIVEKVHVALSMKKH